MSVSNGYIVAIFIDTCGFFFLSSHIFLFFSTYLEEFRDNFCYVTLVEFWKKVNNSIEVIHIHELGFEYNQIKTVYKSLIESLNWFSNKSLKFKLHKY